MVKLNWDILKKQLVYLFRINEETKQYYLYNRDYEKINHNFTKDTPNGFNNCVYLYDDGTKPDTKSARIKYEKKLNDLLFKLKDYQEL
jgi:hypothetical protein